MTNTRTQQQEGPSRPRASSVLALLGILAVVVCCALPILIIAAGGLSISLLFGGDALLVAVAVIVVVVILVVVGTMTRNKSRNKSLKGTKPGKGDACCQ